MPIARNLFNLLKEYKPETRAEKKDRLKKFAAEKAAGNEVPDFNQNYIRYGLNHVTKLVEQGTAKLVIIAHDVDPIEMVLWLPQLCRRKDIPFLFVKGKAKLGTFIHKKTATVLAITKVNGQVRNPLSLSRSYILSTRNN